MTRPRANRSLLPLLVGALALTVLGACASGDGGGPGASSTAVPDLAGTTWNLTSYAGADGAQTPAVTEPSVGTLTFLAGGRVAGSTGCNRFTGTYDQSGDALTIATGAITMMGCPGPVGDQEAAVLAALGEVTAAAVVRDSLVLRDSGGSDLLVYSPGLAGLAGTSWTATGINNGTAAVVSDATTSAVTATFEEGNALSGSGGCNTYSSTWTTTPPDGLTIGPVSATEMACEPDVMATEQQYFAALAKVATYQVEGNQLTLRDTDGAVQVSFRQATE